MSANSNLGARVKRAAFSPTLRLEKIFYTRARQRAMGGRTHANDVCFVFGEFQQWTPAGMIIDIERVRIVWINLPATDLVKGNWRSVYWFAA
jgi:hypothetical protein